MEAGAWIQPLIELLGYTNVAVCEQAMWALSNIASDDPEFRDTVISSNAIPHLLALVRPTITVAFLRNITWTLPNLCRNKNPYPCDEVVRQLLPDLFHFL